jgi:hypothetical protein
VADQNFRPLDFYGKDWDMQRYYWSVSTAEAAAVVKFRTERIGEFGDEPVETTLSLSVAYPSRSTELLARR